MLGWQTSPILLICMRNSGEITVKLMSSLCRSGMHSCGFLHASTLNRFSSSASLYFLGRSSLLSKVLNLNKYARLEVFIFLKVTRGSFAVYVGNIPEIIWTINVPSPWFRPNWFRKDNSVKSWGTIKVNFLMLGASCQACSVSPVWKRCNPLLIAFFPRSFQWWLNKFALDSQIFSSNIKHNSETKFRPESVELFQTRSSNAAPKACNPDSLWHRADKFTRNQCFGFNRFALFEICDFCPKNSNHHSWTF